MLPRPPASLLTAFSFLILIAASVARSQTPSDGFTVQERAGIVLVKPQAWSKDNEAVVVEFQAFTDRTASGASGAGYIEFRTKGSPKRQIPTARIVKMVVYPEPHLVKEVLTDQDRDALAAVADEIKTTIAKYPASRTYVEPALKKVQEEVATYDSGKVKTGGAWVARDVYVAERARTFASQIKPDILSAKPPSSFDLVNDPRFLALQDFAKSNASVKPLVTELSNMHGKLVRAETRQNLLAKLAGPDLGFPGASAAVTQLKSLQPEEDPRTVLFLKNWDANVAKVNESSEQAKKLAAALESEMTTVKPEEALPEISPQLDQQIAALNLSMASFTASKPPAPLLAEAGQALAVCATASGFGKLKAIIADRQFLEAKDVLDQLSGQVTLIGPETVRVVAGLQTVAASSISEFSRLREEGKVQADANKPAEALAAYEKAFAVIPDPAVGEQIAELKAKLPPKK
jgi:hypothetical protein